MEPTRMTGDTAHEDLSSATYKMTAADQQSRDIVRGEATVEHFRVMKVDEFILGQCHLFHHEVLHLLATGNNTLTEPSKKKKKKHIAGE